MDVLSHRRSLYHRWQLPSNTANLACPSCQPDLVSALSACQPCYSTAPGACYLSSPIVLSTAPPHPSSLMKSPHRTDPLRRPQGDFFHVFHALALNVRRCHHVTPRTFGRTLLPPYPESSPPIYPSAPGPYRWTEGLHPQHGGATLYDYVMDRVKTRLAADFEGARLRCTSVLATHLTGAMIERLGPTHWLPTA